MSELPEGWKSVILNDVGDITTGNTPPTKQTENYGGTIPFVKPGDLDSHVSIVSAEQTLSEIGSKQARVLRTGAVLVSCIGNLGKVGIAGIPLATNQQINSIEFEPSLVNDHYGYYYCKTLRPWMEDQASATTVTILNKGKFAKAPFVLAPLAEQKRIADKLDALLARVDRARTRLDRVPLILKRFRQAVLSAATSGQLTEDWREENGSERLPNIVSLEDTGATFSYGSSAKSSTKGTIPVLRMGNIQNGRLDWKDLVFTSDSEEISKYSLFPGDVLFNRTNSPELVGKTAVYKGEQPAIYAGYLIRLKCSSNLLPDYINYCLNSPAGRDYCWRVKSDGVSQSNINAKKLAAFEFDLPPLAEQHEIVRRVETLFSFADRLQARYQAARSQVDQLTPALLAQAFRGELVPQDPNDEPAALLLERIRKNLGK